MAMSRAVCSWSLVLCVSMFVACGDDDDPPPSGGGKSGTGGTAGRGGSGGRGGASGTGMMGSGGGGMAGSGGMTGSGGSAGRGGTTGSAGSSGTAGDASAGTAGTAGSAGTAGADSSAGTAGAAGNDAGNDSSVDTGTPDTGADTGPDAAAARMCVERCEDDDDCRVGDAANSGFVCRSNRCVSTQLHCTTSDAECIPGASNWTVACPAGTCPGPILTCIDIGGGVGRCAIPEGSAACAAQKAVFPMPRFGDGGMVNVCGDNTKRCDTATKTCRAGCNVDNDCPPGSGCNTTTHLCGCRNDTQCTGRPGVSACNEDTGLCECTQHSDCDAVEGDVCVNGQCGCSGISACSKFFDGTTETCE
jgi:hypothetical protein